MIFYVLLFIPENLVPRFTLLFENYAINYPALSGF